MKRRKLLVDLAKAAGLSIGLTGLCGAAPSGQSWTTDKVSLEQLPGLPEPMTLANREPRRVLFILTGASQLSLTNGLKFPTGTYAEEFVEPYLALRGAGFLIEIATPGGVVPPFDRKSLEKDANFAKVVQAAPELQKPLNLDEMELGSLDRYLALVVPGGHGPMQDLANSRALGRLLVAAQQKNLWIAAICHGSAGLLPAQAEGWIFQGYRMTGFSKAEEDLTPVAGLLDFELEERLLQCGADYQKVAPKNPLVVRDRRLITGQNPASAKQFAEELVRALQ